MRYGFLPSFLILTSCALQSPTVIGDVEVMLARERRALYTAELRELRGSPGGERLMESICDQWGRHSKEMDVTVLHLIWETSEPSICVMDGRMLASLLSRIEKDPTLLRQIFWHRRWEAARNLNGLPVGEFSEPFLVASFERMSRGFSGRFRVYALLLFASMLDRPDLVAGMTLENVDERWNRFVDEFEVTVPYYRYFPESGTFQLDQDALHNQQEVGIAGQAWTVAATEIPPREYP